MPQPTAVRADETVRRWHAAVEAGDADAAAACLTADAVLISPLTEQFRFVGRDAVRDVLRAAFGVLDDIRVTSRLDGDGIAAVVARARIGTQELQDVQLLRLDGDGLITEVTLAVRPLPALTALMSALGPALARGQGRPRLARFLSAATAPLNAMTRFGDRRVVPLADPGRAPAR